MLNSTAQKRLLVVEDDELLSQTLTSSLSSHGHDVEALLTGEDIPRAMERSNFQLIILDLQLPGRSGLYWLKWFKNYYASLPIIIISARTKPEQRVEGLQEGALDYLVKPFHYQELLIKVDYFLKQKVQEPESSILTIGDFTLDTVNHFILKGGIQIPLTALECKILQLLALNAGTPLSREELMWQTLGIRYVPSNRSIDTHINRIRNKIETVASEPAYIRTVRGRGYCFYLPNSVQT